MALTTNLVSYWKLDGNSNDSVGTCNGSDSGVSYVSGLIGSAAQSGSISLPNSPSQGLPGGVNDFTISTWIFGNTGTASVLYQKNDNVSGDPYSDLTFSYDVAGTITLTFRVPFSFSFYPVTSTGTLPSSQWNHCVAVRSAGNTLLYINGSLDKTGASNSSTLDWATVTNHNINPGTGNKLDETAIYTRAISSTEVSDLYNGGVGLQYPFVSPQSFLLGLLGVGN